MLLRLSHNIECVCSFRSIILQSGRLRRQSGTIHYLSYLPSHLHPDDLDAVNSHSQPQNCFSTCCQELSSELLHVAFCRAVDTLSTPSAEAGWTYWLLVSSMLCSLESKFKYVMVRSVLEREVLGILSTTKRRTAGCVTNRFDGTETPWLNFC